MHIIMTFEETEEVTTGDEVITTPEEVVEGEEKKEEGEVAA